MMKKCVVGFVMCLVLLAGANAWAQTIHVLDTGDPNERVCNPKSYIDLGNGIVRDNVTGLEWVQDGNLMASRDPDFDNDGTAEGAVTWQAALDYMVKLNGEEYLGYSDWRLPTIEELSTLVDAGRYNPATDPVLNTVADNYWSSTIEASTVDSAWHVFFYDGGVGHCLKDANYLYVRAVRGEPYVPLDNFFINGDGTVTDQNTGLIWQQCNYGQTWDGSQCIGSAAPLNWDEAFNYIQELNDKHYLAYSDWRLPTRNELQGLVDYSRLNPATTFPNTASGRTWSSSTNAGNIGAPANVGFFYGDVQYFYKTYDLYVRSVRGGACWINDAECLGHSDCDDVTFCNGVETCDNGTCVSGPFPCQSGELCDEVNDLCGECLSNSDCSDGYECVEGVCVTADNPPAIGDGPFLAAGPWPVLPTAAESAFELDANYSVLWTFSDDYASCSGPCTHVAEYQAVGESEWTELTVTTDPSGEWYAYVELPVDQLQNATTYALRFTVTDCADQSTQSGEYYFRVKHPDNPPVFGDGPFLAAGPWPLLPTSQESPMYLKRNYSVLWTFSDDYGSCTGPCTHRARYKPVDGSTWTELPVSTDPDGTWYAFAELPVSQLKNGTYCFVFDVTDCAGQATPSGTYYFTVNKIDDVRQYQSRVSSSTDDGMQKKSDGQIILCNTYNTLTMLDLDLCRDDDYYGGSTCSRACACQESVLSAMRFTNVTVPPVIEGVPVVVSNAYIEFTARPNSGSTAFKSAALTLTITAQAADNPVTIGTVDYDISSRTDTAASVTWSVPAGAWTDNNKYQTPDLTTIVQELINRPGWAAGNAMFFKINAGTENGGRTANSFDSNPTLAPRLVIEYDTEGEPL